MKVTITYKLNGASKTQDFSDIREQLLGPLKTGTWQANYQLKSEGSPLRLALVESEIKEG